MAKIASAYKSKEDKANEQRSVRNQCDYEIGRHL